MSSTGLLQRSYWMSPHKQMLSLSSLRKRLEFFTTTYHADRKSFPAPPWMPTPPVPDIDFDSGGIRIEEVSAAIKKSKARSAPCPLNGIPYRVFKKCPVLVAALHNLFSACWIQSTVPDQCKMASVKLIGKPAAKDNPTSPTNFRPIALTPCIGKLFTSILCERWLSFMISKNYLDRRIQKAFIPKTPGCTEQHLKLATVLNDA